MLTRGPLTVLVLLPLALLAGCGSSGSSTVAAASASVSGPPTASPSAAAGPSSTSPSSSPSIAPTASRTAADQPTIVLEPDGLGAFVGGASIRQLPFDSTPAEQVVATVDAVLGTGTDATNSECGQGSRRTHTAGGFQVLLDGSRFAGWFDPGTPGRHLTTANGIGIGMTLGELEKLLPGVQVLNETLGPEFTDGNGFGGFLTGTTATSTVTKLYAGETCFFR